MISPLFLLVCSFLLISGCKERRIFEDVGPIVTTLSGSVVGKNIKVLDKDVATFFGIPFAIPPIGERRFKKPEPVRPWEGAVIAHKISKPCMQFTIVRNISVASYGWESGSKSEDCLYLNIWSPTKCEDQRLPVLVWIYGGGFTSGSSDMELYNATVLSAVGNVVVVTFNYRVGSFGFLATESDEVPGNAGMYDQVLALQWVKDNIQAFGGDSESITLFGESAGAISTSLHMISPLSRGLFHRAILQSGSAYGSLVIQSKQDAVEKAHVFAEMAGCNQESSTSHIALLKCLRSIEAMDLSKLEANLTARFPVLFGPTYPEDFLPKAPRKAFNSKEVAQVEIMTGVMKDEASVFLEFIIPEYFPYNKIHEDMELDEDKVPKLDKDTAWEALLQLYKLAPRFFIWIIWYQYLSGICSRNSEALVEGVKDSFGDSAFNCPVSFFAENFDTAYMYLISHRSLKNPTPKWVGATHFDDVPYVFGHPLVDKEHFNAEDEEFSRDIIQKWTTFARTGNPMGENDDSWPKFNSHTRLAYELNPRGSKSVPFPRYHKCMFWHTVFRFMS